LIAQVLWFVISVTVAPGWSDPIAVTEEPNTTQPVQFITRDQQGRFHLIWENYCLNSRIGYKVFLLDGTTVVPDTMISDDQHSAVLKTTVHNDSLFAFWRDFSPAYYCIRSLDDGSEITPPTYLFSESTLYPHILASSDSLGRLHTLRVIGLDIYYAVWIPTADAGFTEEYGWFIPDAIIRSQILVDGDRVHIVKWDSLYQDTDYLQYDLQGNLVVPAIDIVDDGVICFARPSMAIDNDRNLLILDEVAYQSQFRMALWKVDGETGELLINMKTLVLEVGPEMSLHGQFDLLSIPGGEQFYMIWIAGSNYKMLDYAVIDAAGDFVVEPVIAYDHRDEDPEQLKNLDGVVDSEGNLYVIYGQGEEYPIFGRYPTFGWFDHNWLGIEDESTTVEPPNITLTLSSNPFTDFLSIEVTGSSYVQELLIYDITGRQVISLGLTDGDVFLWDGSDGEGNQLPSGTYLIRAETQGSMCAAKVVKLD